ncbi:MAG: hypothetical protein ACI9YE_002482 [Psychroserpens sp.]|jgi:hypothetical protein
MKQSKKNKKTLYFRSIIIGLNVKRKFNLNLQLKTNCWAQISSSVFENEIVGNFKSNGQVNLFTDPMLIVKANRPIPKRLFPIIIMSNAACLGSSHNFCNCCAVISSIDNSKPNSRSDFVYIIN